MGGWLTWLGFGSGLIGTLNAGYYVIDGGKQTQIRLWGRSGWFHLELDGRPQCALPHELVMCGIRDRDICRCARTRMINFLELGTPF